VPVPIRQPRIDPRKRKPIPKKLQSAQLVGKLMDRTSAT
jgi:hypothetical protein